MKKPPYDTVRPYLAFFVILRKDNKVAFVLRQNIVPAVRHYFECIKQGKMYSEYGWEE